MWLLYAVGSALFAGLTSILAKCGIRKTDSTVATAIRTFVVLLFSWEMVFVVQSQHSLGELDGKTVLFLVLSGLSTGAGWLCYFRALQIGDINKVVPIDKCSTVLTILLAALFLGEPITLWKGVGALLIGVGTLMMVEKKQTEQTDEKSDGEKEDGLGSVYRPGIFRADRRGVRVYHDGVYGRVHACGADAR